jgi:hypothetical protein
VNIYILQDRGNANVLYAWTRESFPSTAEALDAIQRMNPDRKVREGAVKPKSEKPDERVYFTALVEHKDKDSSREAIYLIQRVQFEKPRGEK